MNLVVPGESVHLVLLQPHHGRGLAQLLFVRPRVREAFPENGSIALANTPERPATLLVTDGYLLRVSCDMHINRSHAVHRCSTGCRVNTSSHHCARISQMSAASIREITSIDSLMLAIMFIQR